MHILPLRSWEMLDFEVCELTDVGLKALNMLRFVKKMMAPGVKLQGSFPLSPPSPTDKIIISPPSWCSAEQYGSSFCLIKFFKYLFVYFN